MTLNELLEHTNTSIDDIVLVSSFDDRLLDHQETSNLVRCAKTIVADDNYPLVTIDGTKYYVYEMKLIK